MAPIGRPTLPIPPSALSGLSDQGQDEAPRLYEACWWRVSSAPFPSPRTNTHKGHVMGEYATVRCRRPSHFPSRPDLGRQLGTAQRHPCMQIAAPAEEPFYPLLSFPPSSFLPPSTRIKAVSPRRWHRLRPCPEKKAAAKLQASQTPSAGGLFRFGPMHA